MQPSYTGNNNAINSQPQKVAGYNVAYSPQQMQLFQQMMGLASPENSLYKMATGDPTAYQAQEQQALRQFGDIQGGLASRFSGMGTGGRHSSGFQNTATSAASDFAQSLASQRQNLQRQALLDLSSLSQQLLNPLPLSRPKKKKSFWEQLLQGASPLAGAGLGFAFGGLPGAQFGGQLGSTFAEAFE